MGCITVSVDGVVRNLEIKSVHHVHTVCECVDGVVSDDCTFVVTWVERNCSIAGVTGVEGVTRDGCEICVTVGVCPDISDFSTIVERVVRDSDVVCSDHTVVVVVVCCSLEHHTDTTVVEGVTRNNATVATRNLHADIGHLNRVVQRCVTLVVGDG